MMLFLALPALAHLPHDMVGYFAAPADLSKETPWWVGGFIGGKSELHVSTNQGLSWSKSSKIPSSYYIDDIAYMDDGTLVVASGRKLLYSYDSGTTFVETLAPDRVVDLAGNDSLWIATPSGVYETSDPAVTATLALEGSFAKVAASGKYAAAVSVDGMPFILTDGSWTRVDPPLGEHVNAIAADGAFMGTFTGRVYSLGDGVWDACGPLLGTGAEHSAILQIAQDGDNVIVATGLGGPYVGVDGCSGWLDHSVSPLPTYGMQGGVHDQEDAFTALMAVDGDWVVGGWAGLYISNNYGAVWREAQWFLSGRPMLLKPDQTEGADEGLTDAADPTGEESPSRGCFGAAAQAMLVLPVLAGLRRRRTA